MKAFIIIDENTECVNGKVELCKVKLYSKLSEALNKVLPYQFVMEIEFVNDEEILSAIAYTTLNTSEYPFTINFLTSYKKNIL